MRKKDEVLQKFRDLYARRLKERHRGYLSRTPINCVSNRRHRVRNNGTIGFCCHSEVIAKTPRFAFVCDCDKTAKSCQHFECKNTAETVAVELDKIVREPSQCGQQYPRLAVLLWCLQDDSPNENMAATTKLGRLLNLIRSIVSFRWW